MPKASTTVSAYFAQQPKERQKDLRTLHSLIRKCVPELKPFFLECAGDPIIGYGKYAYETKSGCKGDWFTVGLSNRKNYISLYIVAVKDGKYLAEHYKKKLPKCKVGKSCISIKRLEDVELSVLETLITEALHYKCHG